MASNICPSIDSTWTLVGKNVSLVLGGAPDGTNAIKMTASGQGTGDISTAISPTLTDITSTVAQKFYFTVDASNFFPNQGPGLEGAELYGFGLWNNGTLTYGFSTPVSQVTESVRAVLVSGDTWQVGINFIDSLAQFTVFYGVREPIPVNGYLLFYDPVFNVTTVGSAPTDPQYQILEFMPDAKLADIAGNINYPLEFRQVAHNYLITRADNNMNRLNSNSNLTALGDQFRKTGTYWTSGISQVDALVAKRLLNDPGYQVLIDNETNYGITNSRQIRQYDYMTPFSMAYTKPQNEMEPD